MSLEIIPKEKKEDIVYNRLLANIRNNIWVSGEKLPSENELCSQLGVSRISVRSAIQRLRAIGLVETKHGLGTFVSKNEVVDITGFGKTIDLSEKDFNEISILREAIESASLQLIKDNLENVDLSEIRCRYFAMKEALNRRDSVAYTHNDFMFHMAIIRASGNDLFTQICNIYKVQLFKYFQEMNKFIFENSNISEDLIRWCDSEYDGHLLVYNYLFNNSPDNPIHLMHVFTSGNKKRFESYLSSLGKREEQQESIVTDYYVGCYSYPVKQGDGSTYTGNGEGIAHVLFNESNGEFCLSNITRGVKNPSYLIVNRQLLYSVNELDEYEGNAGGAVSVYRIAQDYSLSLLEQMSTHGESPCNLALSPDGKIICVSNYNGGSLYSIPLNEKGLFADEGILFKHEGVGVKPIRQEKPHVHSAFFTYSGTYALIADLGLDEICIYKVRGANLSEEKTIIKTPPGSGPRLIEYNSNKRVYFVLCELSNEILVYQEENEQPSILMQRISTLPSGYNDDNRAGDLVMSRDYKWLYVSNRGHNSIACYEILDSGNLALKTFVPCRGDEPRSIVVSDSGKWLICCNQKSDELVAFSITNGVPEFATSLSIGAPTCFKKAKL